jgi:DNA polymerase III epsilon subunit-like protein
VIIKENIIIILDTETTGLVRPSAVGLALQPRIIEFAAIRLNKRRKIIDSVEFLCQPGLPLEKIITKITGITDADLEDKEPFSSHVPRLTNFFAGANQIVAHNHQFDRTLTLFELQRLGWTDGFLGCYATPVCTVEATYHLQNRRLKMTELYEIATGKPLAQKHRAMDDVMALLECVIWCENQGIPL